jgi:hypothetical protein
MRTGTGTMIRGTVTGSLLIWLIISVSSTNADAAPYSADSLPAFKSDSALADPFRQVESGPSPFAAKPAPGAAADTSSGRRLDSVTSLLRKRRPAVSVYLGVDFIDFGAKEKFQNALTARTAAESLTTPLQNYEPVHLAFPIGIQALWPIGTYVDLVAKTHSYWYKETAILGTAAGRTASAGEEWYAVQGNLGGAGMRFCIPPALLSVSGQLGLYTQGIWYWNLGNSELYSRYGDAPARFNPWGSGYEIQLGFQQAITKPWQLTGAIGFLHQQFDSDKSWSSLLAYAAPAGKVSWGISAVQANLNLWYHFGVVNPPSPAAKPAAVDSSRHF